MSFFRYPGGKAKLSKTILTYFNLDPKMTEYREPFFGGGSIGLEFIKQNPIQNIWINDLDENLAYLWNSVIEFPDELKEMIRKFKPSVKHFDSFRKQLLEGTCDDIVECGFMKLAMHQMSYSGLGLKSGGPLGGRDQKSKYPIDCRWSPDSMCKKIDSISKLLNTRDWKCTSMDFEDVISDTERRAFIYLDPPYYEKGQDLYQFAFSNEDHERLAKLLKKTKHQWVLSYDDCPEIRKLYSWAQIHSTEVNYSITSSMQENGERTGNKKMEVIITNV